MRLWPKNWVTYLEDAHLFAVIYSLEFDDIYWAAAPDLFIYLKEEIWTGKLRNVLTEAVCDFL